MITLYTDFYHQLTWVKSKSLGSDNEMRVAVGTVGQLIFMFLIVNNFINKIEG